MLSSRARVCSSLLSRCKSMSGKSIPIVSSNNQEATTFNNNIPNNYRSLQFNSFSTRSIGTEKKNQPPNTNNDNETSDIDSTKEEGGSFLENNNMFLTMVGYYSEPTTLIRRSSQIFASMEKQSQNKQFYSNGKVMRDFKSSHLLLSLHLWLIHRRIITDDKRITEKADGKKEGSTTTTFPSSYFKSGNKKLNPTVTYTDHPKYNAKSLQESIFDSFWDNTLVRIRGQKVPEMMVNKQLTKVQKYTFAALVTFDHSLTFQTEELRRSELASALYREVYQSEDDLATDHVMRLVTYIEHEYDMIMKLPEEHFVEGRIPWGPIPEWNDIIDDFGGVINKAEDLERWKLKIALKEKEVEDNGGVIYPCDSTLEEGWRSALSDGGKLYYFNEASRESRWDRPEKKV